MKKKILIHSIAFAPDGVSTAYIYNDLALGFKKFNYDVIVLTSTPHYNFSGNYDFKKYFFGLFYVSFFKEIKVIHIPLKKHNSTLIRIALFIRWHFLSLLIGLLIRRIDYILSPSPPLSIGIISIIIGKIKRAKIIYNVQEVYPDLLINQGNLKSKIIIKLLHKLEKFVYNYSDSIVTINEKFYNQIKNRVGELNTLQIIPNFVDTHLYKPSFSNLNLPKEFKNNDKTTVLYAGNIGYFQDWEPIFYTAKKIKNLNIEFIIIGEGVKKNYLIDRVKNENISNIKIFPYQKRSIIPAIINMADIHFISIEKKLEKEGFPSKVYTIMACKKPMIVVSGKNTPIYEFLYPKKCSILISKNRNENFYSSVIKLANDKKLRNELGENGYNEIMNNYTKEKIINQYLNLFNKI